MMAFSFQASMVKSTWEVWKFGGVSLADGRAMQDAIHRIRKHHGPLAVVASALAGVTDLLLAGADAASRGGRDEAVKAAATLKRKHHQVAGQLLKGRRLTRSLAAIDESAREYDAICGAIAVLGHLTPRVRDAVVARGERLSAQLLAAALESEGDDVAYIDAAAIVRTDDRHGSATPSIDATRRRLSAFLREAGSAAAERLVIPGFIGAAPDGSVTTMGRGRIGPDRHARRPLLTGTAGGAVERRARDPHRGSPHGDRRAGDSRAAPA